MTTYPKITSDFALLDVKRGRKALAKHFKNRPIMGACPQEMRIPITITGYISHQYGADDGISIEFGVRVESVKVGDQP